MLTYTQIINNWTIFGLGIIIGIVITFFMIGLIQIIIHERRAKQFYAGKKYHNRTF